MPETLEPSSKSTSAVASILDLFRTAIAREAQATATFELARAHDGVNHAAGTFGGTVVDVTPDVVILAVSPTPPAPRGQTPMLATVTIPDGDDEVIFFSTVVPRSEFDEPPPVPGTIALQMPDEVIITRRRKSFRSVAGSTAGIEMRLWRIDKYAILRDTPRPSLRFDSELVEISADGFGAILRAQRTEAMQLKAGDRFRVQIVSGEIDIVFDSRLIHPRATHRDQDSARCGFAFIHDDKSIESRRSRQKLESILAMVQRTAAAAAKRDVD